MSKTLLLYAVNPSEAVEEISALEVGRVTQQLGPSILLAVFPEDFDKQRLNSSTTEIPTTLDEDSKLAVEAWRRCIDHEPSRKEKETDGLKRETPGFQPPSVDDGTIHNAAIASRPQTIAKNDRLLGTVAIGSVIVSCSGGLEFSKDEIEKVRGQIAKGTQYLASKEPAAGVSVIYEHNEVKVPGDKQVSGTGISSGPSAVVYKGKIYCFHQGKGAHGELWYNIFDGSYWERDKQVSGTDISSGPSAVVYKDKIYCFHQGKKANGELWYNIFDGSYWEGDKQVSGTGISENPSAIVAQFPVK